MFKCAILYQIPSRSTLTDCCVGHVINGNNLILNIILDVSCIAQACLNTFLPQKVQESEFPVAASVSLEGGKDALSFLYATARQ